MGQVEWFIWGGLLVPLANFIALLIIISYLRRRP